MQQGNFYLKIFWTDTPVFKLHSEKIELIHTLFSRAISISINSPVDFQSKVIKYEYCTLRMQFWDIAGQDRVKVLSRNYYNGASACIIVFDITNSKSFEDVKEWKTEIDNKLGQIPTIVLANKVGRLVILRELVWKFKSPLKSIKTEVIQVKNDKYNYLWRTNIVFEKQFTIPRCSSMKSLLYAWENYIVQQDLVDDISEPKRACVDDMDLDNLKDTIRATEVFHVSAKTGYQVKQSMQLLEKIVSFKHVLSSI